MITPLPTPRGLRHYQDAAPSVFSGMLLMLSLSIWLWSQSLSIFDSWSSLTHGISLLVGEPLEVTMSLKGGLAAVVDAKAVLPDWTLSSLMTVLFALALIGGSFLLSPEKLPLRYLLRTISVVLLLPIAGLVLYGNVTVLDTEAHLSTIFQTGYWFLVLLPIFYAATAFVLPGNFVFKLIYVLIALAYFFLFVPVLALFHYYSLILFGPAITPFLSVFFNVLIFSIEFIAFYGVIASQS